MSRHSLPTACVGRGTDTKTMLLVITAITLCVSVSQESAVRHRRQHLLESLSQTRCLDKCSCKWKGGKITVECNPGSFTEIPDGFDPNTQVLIMDGNVLQVLRAKSFLNVKLNNLQRIHCERCGITTIDDNTFLSVTNLVELHLAHNFLSSVPTIALQNCPNLRKVYFNYNSITKLSNNSFADLIQLQIIDLSNNQIDTIEAHAFFGLKNLKTLKINNNRLR